MKKITIISNPDGSIAFEVEGAQGSSCDHMTKSLRDRMNIEEDNLKPEYFEEVTEGGVKEHE